MSKKKVKVKEKRQIQVAIPYIDLDFTGEIEEVVGRLSQMKGTVIDLIHKLNEEIQSRPKALRYIPYPHVPEILKIEKESGYDGDVFTLTGYRVETDEEFKERLEKEEELSKKLKQRARERAAKMKKEEQEQEKKLYETLKKKYGEG